jgi:membrane protease YdiL (CAAX protease family)
MLYFWLSSSGYSDEELSPLFWKGWLPFAIAFGAGVSCTGLGGFVAARLAKRRQLLQATIAAVVAAVLCLLFLGIIGASGALNWLWWSYPPLAVVAGLFGGDLARHTGGKTRSASGRRAPSSGYREELSAPPGVPWTLTDILLVSLLLVFGSSVYAFLEHGVLHGIRITAILRQFSDGLLGLCLPIFYLRRRYSIPPAGLGLRRGRLHPLTSVALGVGLAAAYHLLVRAHLPGFLTGDHLSFRGALLFPLSLHGFSATVLAPLSEEVMFRGFLYLYLRKVLGSLPGLVIQAVLFSGLHGTSYSNSYLAINRILIGLMLGLLFEKTRSLYPSIVCHSSLNYLLIVFAAS